MKFKEKEIQPPEKQETSQVFGPVVMHSTSKTPVNKKLIVIFLSLVFIFIIVGVLVIRKNSDKQPDLSSAQPETSRIVRQPEQVSVAIMASGLSPATIKVSLGSTIIWTNTDKTSHSLVFANNEDYNSDALKPNDTFSLIFEHTGTYTYRDPAAKDFSGTVIVE
jgi:plastocyanin